VAACTGDDDAAWPEGGVPLELNAVVEGYEANGARTRAATTENRWEGGEEVDLYVRNHYIEQVGNVSMNSDGKLVAYTSMNWISPDEEKTIYALYPALMGVLSFPVEDDQTGEGYQQSDYMVAPYIRITVTSPDKTLTFRHLAAKVVVHLEAGDGVTDDELQNATVTFENLNRTGYGIDRNEGTALQVLPAADRIIPNEVTPAANGYVRTVRALFIPQDQAGILFVVYDTAFYYFIEVRENSHHRRKDLLLHPRFGQGKLLQRQDVRVPPHRNLGRHQRYRRGGRHVAAGRVVVNN
jgi:hypothetical protein